MAGGMGRLIEYGISLEKALLRRAEDSPCLL